MSTEVARYEPAPIAIAHERSIEELMAQANKIKQAMEQAMEVDQHYGIIPGACKPSLWKPGAEKLCLLFRLDPQYHSEPVAPDSGASRSGERIVPEMVTVSTGAGGVSAGGGVVAGCSLGGSAGGSAGGLGCADASRTPTSPADPRYPT